MTYRYGFEAAELSKEKLEKIKNYIMEGSILDHIDSYKTHVLEKHCLMSDIDGLDRVLSGETSSHGRFLEHESGNVSEIEAKKYVKHLLSEAMLYDINATMRWLKDDTLTNGERHEVIMPVREIDDLGYIGSVFERNEVTDMIREYKANCVRIVLEMDESQILGFQMVTAYPSVSDSFSPRVETGKDLQPLATQTQTYQRGFDKLKTAILFQADQKNHVPVHYYSTYSGKEFLHIDVKLKATKNIYRISIEKDRNQIVKQSHDQSGAKWMESKYAKVYRKATQRTNGYCVDLENSVVQKYSKKICPK